MANQPARPPRQWFRFPSLARSSPDPLPAPPPSSLNRAPPLPAKNFQKSPSKPPPTSQVFQASAPPPAKLKSETQTPMQAEPKTILMVENSVSEKPKPRPIITNNSDKNAHWEAKEFNHLKNKKISEDGMGKVITLSGENKGAVMQIIDSPMKKYETDGNNNWLSYKTINGSNGEEGVIKKEKSQKGKKMGRPRMSAFINSNVQGINNSIIYNSTCTGHDPGVHVSLLTKPNSGQFVIKDHGNGFQA